MYPCEIVSKRVTGGKGRSLFDTYHPARATARVPTPLHTAPALTMTTKGSSLATSHSKGGGGVERGGDPCGRPAGGSAAFSLRYLVNHDHHVSKRTRPTLSYTPFLSHA